MLQNHFQIDLLFEEGSTQKYCITDRLSKKVVATFNPDQIRRDVNSSQILETFKNIFHEPVSDDQGIFISYATAKNRTLDVLATA